MPRGSSLPDAKEVVAAGYDRVASQYAGLEWAGSQWPRLRRLREVLAELPPGSRVLDLGCGHGIPALAAIAKRHEATGVDISAAQVEAARANVPGARVLEGDAAACDFPAETFDAVVAFYVLDHIPREEHSALFARIAGWLRPGGLLLFTTELEEDEGTVGEWLGTPMFFSQFHPSITAGLVEEAGFELVSRQAEPQLEGDREITYVWFLARKR
jgi:cyclopropane fatty-acyl-phospholipid synthase-like methyltransferase